jgi:hypothetical protein
MPPSARLVLAATLALVLTPLAVRARPRPSLRVFDSPAEALAAVMAEKPRVLGIGEYHEIENGPKAPSALHHLLVDGMFDGVAPRASHLVLETWVTEGRCGKKEKQVAKKVEEDTERPDTTEDELVTLIKKARAAGVQPGILTVSCVEYLTMIDAKGEIDYVRLLALITDHLEREIRAALDEDKARNGKAGKDRVVLVYGGALHNDYYPRKELADYSYARAIRKATGEHYVEVDLYVPEFIARDSTIPTEPWYKLVDTIPAGKTGLVQRGPHSYILLFARTPGAETAAPREEQPAATPDGGAPPDAGH